MSPAAHDMMNYNLMLIYRVAVMGCLLSVPSETFLDCFLTYRYGFLNRQKYCTVCNTNEQIQVFCCYFCLFSTKNAFMKLYVFNEKLTLSLFMHF